RLALAFQSLVREPEQQQRMLALAKDEVAASPLGSTEGFEGVWNSVAEKMLTSYSDESFVSDEYGRELSGSRTKAIEVEQTRDDRRGAVRAREDHVRVARRSAGAASGRSALGRRAAAAARAAHVDPAGIRIRRAAHDRASEELAKPGGAPHGHSTDAPVRRDRVASRPDGAARRQRAAGAARSGPRDSERRPGRG